MGVADDNGRKSVTDAARGRDAAQWSGTTQVACPYRFIPSTSNMSYSPAGCCCSHLAAAIAPFA